MSHHQGKIAPQFFVTAPQPCPYLEGRAERKLFTTLRNPDAAAVNDFLSLRGFRRSQGVVYRPSCAGCNAARPASLLGARLGGLRGRPVLASLRSMKRPARRMYVPNTASRQH